MSSILKTPTLLAPPARESKRGQQSLETQRARALRVFYAALADRRSNPCNIVVMGDSMTEGQGATVWGARWVDRFRDQMRQKFPVTGVTGGVGYISTTNGLTGGSSSIFPVAHSGTVTTNSQSGPKKRSRAFSASGHITTWTVVGTAVDLVYWQGTGTGTVKWSVDGGSTTNQSTVGGSSASGTTFRISLGTAGVHTVTVEWVSGTSYIEGLIVYNGDETTGVRVHEAGRSGFSAYQWDQVNHENASTAWARAVGQLNPHLLIIALGINDWAQSTANGGAAGTAADYKTYLKSLIADVRSNTTIDPSIMLLSYATPNASPYDTAYSFAQYADVCEQIAAEDAEVCTLDLGLRIPKVLGDTLSLYSDTTHFTNKGHALAADLVMQVIGVGGGAGGGGGSTDASDLVSGTLAAARLPAFTGDITTSAGSSATTLATVASAGTTGSSTVVPGVTIDAKGRVTSISSNAIADTTTITGNAQTADYTLVLTDAGKCVEMNKATAVTCTVPTNATVAFPTGTVIEVCQLGAGAVTVAAAGGVTLDGGTAITSARYQSLFLRKRATDEWVLTGSVQLGEIGYAAITADVTQAAVGNALVAGLSTTITAPGGRPLNIVVSAELKQSASGSGAAMTIEEDGTQIVEIALIAAAANQAVAVERTVRRTPAAGLHTYRVRLYASTSGTATLIAAPTNPAFIQVVQV